MKGLMRSLALMATLALTSCASPDYRYAFIVLSTSPGKVLAEGQGKANLCKAVFEPPAVYMGPTVAIPEDAAIIGALVVTKDQKVAALPLRKWKSKDGQECIGCNGPAPQFAHQARTAEDLARSIAKVLEAN